MSVAVAAAVAPVHAIGASEFDFDLDRALDFDRALDAVGEAVPIVVTLVHRPVVAPADLAHSCPDRFVGAGPDPVAAPEFYTELSDAQRPA